MRLSKVLVENPIQRREFLKRGAGAVSTALVGKGVPAQVARLFDVPAAGAGAASGGQYYLRGFVDGTYSNSSVGSAEVSSDFFAEWLGYASNKRDVRMAVEEGSEELAVLVPVDAATVQKLIAGSEWVDADETAIDVSIWSADGGVEARIYRALPEEWVGERPVKNFLRAWWKKWGMWSHDPISDGLFAKLKANRIDPTVRPEHIREIIRDEVRNSPELAKAYGDLRKYGIDGFTHMPDSPDGDERWASPMHQGMEESLASRLAAIFG